MSSFSSTFTRWSRKSCSRGGNRVSNTVLICDDAIFMRTMVGDILQQAGFEIVGEAETGVQAVEKYKQLRPDLVTMDIVLPDMGGIDAVREITTFDPNAKVLLCSAEGRQYRGRSADGPPVPRGGSAGARDRVCGERRRRGRRAADDPSAAIRSGPRLADVPVDGDDGRAAGAGDGNGDDGGDADSRR